MLHVSIVGSYLTEANPFLVLRTEPAQRILLALNRQPATAGATERGVWRAV